MKSYKTNESTSISPTPALRQDEKVNKPSIDLLQIEPGRSGPYCYIITVFRG